MSVNLEWDAPQTLVSPYGTVFLNTANPLVGNDSFYYMVRPDSYQIVPGKFRPVVDSISQSDGSSLQPVYIDGLVATLKIEYWIAVRGVLPDQIAACGKDLRLMNQTLMGVLNSLRSYSASPSAQQRYLWTPTGLGDQRMLTDIILASWPVPDFSNLPFVSVTFQVATPFPYSIDATQISTVITSGTSGPVVNNGNASQFPVIQVAGPTSSFAITNLTTGAVVSYTGAAIAAGKYAEIDFFRGTITLKPDNVNLIAGLDPTVTDFFPLAPGSQTIAATGGTITVLSNNAWL